MYECLIMDFLSTTLWQMMTAPANRCKSIADGSSNKDGEEGHLWQQQLYWLTLCETLAATDTLT